MQPPTARVSRVRQQQRRQPAEKTKRSPALRRLLLAGVSPGRSAKPSIPPCNSSIHPAILPAPSNTQLPPSAITPSIHAIAVDAASLRQHSSHSPATLRAKPCIPIQLKSHLSLQGVALSCDPRASTTLLSSASVDNAPLAINPRNPHHRLTTVIIRGLLIDPQMAP
jgi:hypothetical protein